MLMFTLAISCLTTSNLPWFTDLTFQVLMQYCSYAILLKSTSDFTFITRHIHNWVSFLLWASPSFLLELLVIALCFSPRSTLNAFWLGGLIFWCHNFFFFFASLILIMGSCSKNTGVVCHSLFQWTTFRQNLQLWPVCLGGPAQHSL